MDNVEIQNAIINAVKKYNDFFCDFIEEYRLIDRFSIDNDAWQILKGIINKDLNHYLLQGWNYVNQNLNKNGADYVEDALFFYPIVGSIRCNLIEKLREKD